MNMKPKSMKKEIAVVIVITLVFMLITGLLVRNVVVSILSLDMEKSETALDFKEVDKAIQEIAGKLKSQADALTQLAKQPPKAPAVPVPGADGKNAEVKQIRFFEAGRDIPSAKERRYSEQFSSQARYIITEITYKNHNYQVRDAEIPIVVQFLDANGHVIIEKKGMAKPKKEWASASFILSTGDAQPGWWKGGKYTVRITFDGRHIGDSAIRIEE